MKCGCAMWQDEIDDTECCAKELYEALEAMTKYGHLVSCTKFHLARECTCGYAKAKSAIKKARGE